MSPPYLVVGIALLGQKPHRLASGDAKEPVFPVHYEHPRSALRSNATTLATRYRAARELQESMVHLIRIRHKVQGEVGNPNVCAVPTSKKRIAHTGGASIRMMSPVGLASDFVRKGLLLLRSGYVRDIGRRGRQSPLLAGAVEELLKKPFSTEIGEHCQIGESLSY